MTALQLRPSSGALNRVARDLSALASRHCAQPLEVRWDGSIAYHAAQGVSGHETTGVLANLQSEHGPFLDRLSHLPISVLARATDLIEEVGLENTARIIEWTFDSADSRDGVRDQAAHNLVDGDFGDDSVLDLVDHAEMIKAYEKDVHKAVAGVFGAEATKDRSGWISHRALVAAMEAEEVSGRLKVDWWTNLT